MEIIQTILPIFIVIFLGRAACMAGFLPASFTGPANRLVYYLAIPAMIFRAIAGSSFDTHFHAGLLASTLTPLAAAALLAWGLTALPLFGDRSLRGSFIQSSMHGNLGYIGLAVVYYALGPNGLALAAMLTGFIMITHNLLGVMALTSFSIEGKTTSRRRRLAGRMLSNPIILTCLAGIAFSLGGWTMPRVLDRTLNIVGNVAMPLALLLIGASLSFKGLAKRFPVAITSAVIKLLVMPAVGLVLYRLAGYPSEVYLPGLVLLAAPTATVVYVMAQELEGHPEFTVTAISFSTLLSLMTYTFWISIAG